MINLFEIITPHPIKMVSSLLTVMTWNMWFDKKNRAQRTETLLNEVISYDPDIVALQEVVQESLEIIIAKMHPTYYIIGTIPQDIGYDCIILSKFPPIEWDRYLCQRQRWGAIYCWQHYKLQPDKLRWELFIWKVFSSRKQRRQKT